MNPICPCCLGKKLTSLGWKDDNLPILLIGHSSGDLVVKQAMILASLDPRFQSFYRNVTGLVLIGSPQPGTLLADSHRWFGTVQSLPWLDTILAPKPKILDQLDKEFFALWTVDYAVQVRRVHFIYELHPILHRPDSPGIQAEIVRLRPAVPHNLNIC